MKLLTVRTSVGNDDPRFRPDASAASSPGVVNTLAEDLGRDLDAVLDAILRALSHRASSGSVPLQFLRGGRT